MAKSGKRQRWIEAQQPVPDVEQYLFGNGLSADDYRLSEDGVVSFIIDGKIYDLIIDHPNLDLAIQARLRTLGVGSRLP